MLLLAAGWTDVPPERRQLGRQRLVREQHGPALRPRPRPPQGKRRPENMCLYACLYIGCVQGAAPAPTQLTFDNAYNFHGSGHVMGAAVSPMQEFNVQLSAPAHHPFGLHHDTGAGQTRPAPAR